MDEIAPYRIVVRAAAGGIGRKSFVWEIFPRDEATAIKRSRQSFLSMAAAYDDGQVELKRLTGASRLAKDYATRP